MIIIFDSVRAISGGQHSIFNFAKLIPERLGCCIVSRGNKKKFYEKTGKQFETVSSIFCKLLFRRFKGKDIHLHLNSRKDIFMALPFKYLFDVNVVFRHRSKFANNYFNRCLFRIPDKHIFNSRYIQKCNNDLVRGHSAVIYNTLANSAPVGFKSDRSLISFPMRAVNRKEPYLALDVTQHLLTADPTLRINFCINHENTAYARRWHEEFWCRFGGSDRVSIHFNATSKEIFKASKIVMLGREEPLTRLLIECCFHKRLFFGFEEGGNIEIFENGSFGALFSPGASAREIAEIIVSVNDWDKAVFPSHLFHPQNCVGAELDFILNK